jgi:hypothetical protein
VSDRVFHRENVLQVLPALLYACVVSAVGIAAVTTSMRRLVSGAEDEWEKLLEAPHLVLPFSLAVITGVPNAALLCSLLLPGRLAEAFVHSAALQWLCPSLVTAAFWGIAAVHIAAAMA